MQQLFDSKLSVTRNSGIYYLKINELNYIGSSVSIKDRLVDHRRILLRNEHSNPRMQTAFNKYGKDKCWFSVLETFNSITQVKLLQKEKDWIDKLGPILNITQDPTLKFNIRSGKTVYQFELSGHKINSYPSTKEASRQTGISASSIIQNCNGKLLSAGKFLWSYKESARITYSLQRSYWKWKAVEMTDHITGKKKEFPNLAQAAREIYSSTNSKNFDSICAAISSICSGKGKFLEKRYSFKYIL